MQGYWKIPTWDVSNLFASWYRCHQTRGEPQLLRLIHREKHGKERLQRLEDLLKDLQEKADPPWHENFKRLMTWSPLRLCFVHLWKLLPGVENQHRKHFVVTTYVMPSPFSHSPITAVNVILLLKNLKFPQAKRKTLTEMDQKKSEVVLALWKKISEDTTTVPQLFETMNGRRLRDSCWGDGRIREISSISPSKWTKFPPEYGVVYLCMQVFFKSSDLNSYQAGA